MEFAGKAIENLREGQLSNSTPCTEWNLSQLLNHMVYEVAWVAPLVEGKTIAEVGTLYDGNLLGDEPKLAWYEAVDQAIESVKKMETSSTVHLSAGDDTAGNYIDEVGFDVLVHGWDVAQSLNAPYSIPNTLLDRAKELLPKLQAKYGSFGVFAPELQVSSSADDQTKLLAQMGRKA